MTVEAIHRRWLSYARQVVSDGEHIENCRELGGSNPHAIVLDENRTARPANFAPDVRWPGTIGAGYRPGGVLWVANIHRNFDSAGLDRDFAEAANTLIRDWRDNRIDDSAFLEGTQGVYRRGLVQWTVGTWARRTFNRLGIALDDLAYANVAKCQAPDTGVDLQKLCLRRWSLRDLVRDLEPGLVLLTSATAARWCGTEAWPCPVIGFSQRNGRLVKDSPWRPPIPEPTVSWEIWIGHLEAETQSG